MYNFKHMKGVIEVNENLCALKITSLPHCLIAPKLNTSALHKQAKDNTDI